MKIKRLYVKNFGCLCGAAYELTEGLNTINRENGWGKTTLAAFIKAMFYGMESSTKRSLDENEKKRYLPWNGGVYGGMLVFETEDGGCYRIERTFGGKDKEDTFVLYDEHTGMESSAFSEAVGEELFHLDKASFERSILIPQLLQTKPAGATDSINAKLTNLMDSGDDIDAYETAVNKLEEAMKQYRRQGGRGRLDVLEADKIKLEEQLARLQALENTYQKRETQLRQEHTDRALLERKRRDYDTLLEQAGQYDACQQKAKNYREICAELAKQQEQTDEVLRQTFGANGVPAPDALEQAKSCLNNRDRYIEQAKAFTVTQEEEAFYNRAVQTAAAAGRETAGTESRILEQAEAYAAAAKEEMQECRRKQLRLEMLNAERKKLAENEAHYRNLQAQFSNVDPEDDLQKAMGFEKDIAQLDQQLAVVRTRLEAVMAQSEKRIEIPQRREVIYTCTVFGALLIAGGLAAGVLSEQYALCGLALVGILLILYGIVVKRGVASQQRVFEQELQTVRQKQEALEEEAARLEAQRREAFGFVRLLLGRYGISDTEDDMRELETRIRTSYETYRNSRQALQENLNALQALETDAAQAEAEYRSIMARYADITAGWRSCKGEPPDGAAALPEEVEEACGGYLDIVKRRMRYHELQAQIALVSAPAEQFFAVYFPAWERSVASLQRIERECDRLLQCREACGSWQERKASFEAENDIVLIRKILESPVRNCEELKQERTALDAEIEQANGRIRNLELECGRLEEETGQLGELEQRRAHMDAELDEGARVYARLKKTRELLGKAKSEFSVRYLKKLNDSFDGYMKLLDEKTVAHSETAQQGAFGYRLDERLDIKVETDGSRHDVQAMSLGYRDLTALCTRFALVDAMFEGEKPFIILDDPFVNLDGEKLGRAREMLARLAERYQIIYFTCHDSRV